MPDVVVGLLWSFVGGVLGGLAWCGVWLLWILVKNRRPR